LQGTPFEFLASLLEPAALTMPSPVLYLVQYLPLLNPFRELNFGTQQSRDPQILSLLYFLPKRARLKRWSEVTRPFGWCGNC